MKDINLTAVVIALREQEFIDKCLRAIYPFVRRIYVISNYDTDYYGNEGQPDQTIDIVLGFDDPEKKIILLVNRRILDETIQRNWAMLSDKALCNVSHRRFSPHGYTLKEIRDRSPQTDFFWIIDADEIYDPQTIPGAIDFVSRTRWNCVLVRGHNFFKKWNYRISLSSDQFWQIGFLRPGTFFYSRRRPYIPRPLGWIHYINKSFAQRLIHIYCNETKLPENIANFYHASYVGDDERIRKKLLSSSHAQELADQGLDEWFEKVWKQWHPEMENFYFSGNAKAWSGVDYISTSSLPLIIRDSSWPDGWIEK